MEMKNSGSDDGIGDWPAAFGRPDNSENSCLNRRKQRTRRIPTLVIFSHFELSLPAGDRRLPGRT